MPQDATDRTTAARKAAFVRTMLNHPERLKGKTVEEAYAGMRRQVGYNNQDKSKYSGPNAHTVGPKAAYNGQDAATASGAKKVRAEDGSMVSKSFYDKKPAPGSDLLGGKNAKISPAAVERRVKKMHGNRPENYGDVVDKKIGSAAKKTMDFLTKKRGF